MAKRFGQPQRIEVMQCKNKGKKGYCDGKFNQPNCPLKVSFFGVMAAKEGRVHTREGEGVCPTSMTWVLTHNGKKEYVTLVGGGQLKGFKPGQRGPCLFTTMNSTNPEVMRLLKGAFKVAPKGEEAIRAYLQQRLGAPADIIEQAKTTNFRKGRK